MGCPHGRKCRIDKTSREGEGEWGGGGGGKGRRGRGMRFFWKALVSEFIVTGCSLRSYFFFFNFKIYFILFGAMP